METKSGLTISEHQFHHEKSNTVHENSLFKFVMKSSIINLIFFGGMGDLFLKKGFIDTLFSDPRI